jgi:hypothetical protein
MVSESEPSEIFEVRGVGAALGIEAYRELGEVVSAALIDSLPVAILYSFYVSSMTGAVKE